MLKDTKYKGFSLIEILIVVGLILILAAVTIVAINPAKHFRDTRNAERSADVSEILNAVTQFTAEDGNTLADLQITDQTIPACKTNPEDPDRWTDAAEISTVVDTGKLAPAYIVEIPVDPDGSDYRICETGEGRVQILAEKEGENELIVATR